MGLKQIQKCVSHQPYCAFDIPSKSQDNLVYEVYSIFPEDPPEEYICQCRGFSFRGHCEHQRLAHADRCLWLEAVGNEVQTSEQHDKMICPRCGGETFRQTEVDDGQAA